MVNTNTGTLTGHWVWLRHCRYTCGGQGLVQTAGELAVIKIAEIKSAVIDIALTEIAVIEIAVMEIGKSLDSRLGHIPLLMRNSCWGMTDSTL